MYETGDKVLVRDGRGHEVEVSVTGVSERLIKISPPVDGRAELDASEVVGRSGRPTKPAATATTARTPTARAPRNRSRK